MNEVIDKILLKKRGTSRLRSFSDSKLIQISNRLCVHPSRPLLKFKSV